MVPLMFIFLLFSGKISNMFLLVKRAPQVFSNEDIPKWGVCLQYTLYHTPRWRIPNLRHTQVKSSSRAYAWLGAYPLLRSIMYVCNFLFDEECSLIYVLCNSLNKNNFRVQCTCTYYQITHVHIEWHYSYSFSVVATLLFSTFQVSSQQVTVWVPLPVSQWRHSAPVVERCRLSSSTLPVHRKLYVSYTSTVYVTVTVI